jgi:sulfite exporter TauE/SafE
MSLLAAMFPIYVMGNFHCLGMCGPIAMLLGRSPYRGFYLLGRMVSFTLAGFSAGAFGEVLALALKAYHLAGLISILTGLLIGISGLYIMLNWNAPFSIQIEKLFAPTREKFNALLFSREPWPLFLVGFFTIILPCGQTLLVYSACALSGSAWVGTLNGFAFGLLTTPSLYLAMQGAGLLKRMKRFYRPVVGGMSLLIGMIAILRGLADFGLISHFGIHPVIIY